MTAQPADVSDFSGEVHPYAAAFPMLPDADLDALAADIKANGLLNPIILDQDGRLLDGRNRLEACDRAGVKPSFDMIETADPVGLIITANMQRRDLTKSQKAHLLVEAEVSESETLKHGRVRELARVSGVPEATVSEAKIVRKFAPEASRAVIERRLTHAAAYDHAREQKKSDEESKAHLAILRAEAPDLLSLEPAEAWAAYLKRTEKEREKARQVAEAISTGNRSVTEAIFRVQLLGYDVRNVADWLATYDQADTIHPLDKSELRRAITALTALETSL